MLLDRGAIVYLSWVGWSRHEDAGEMRHSVLGKTRNVDLHRRRFGRDMEKSWLRSMSCGMARDERLSVEGFGREEAC